MGGRVELQERRQEHLRQIYPKKYISFQLHSQEKEAKEVLRMHKNAVLELTFLKVTITALEGRNQGTEKWPVMGWLVRAVGA